MRYSLPLLLATILFVANWPAVANTPANKLLTGVASLEDGTKLEFSLEGNSREDVVGGSIIFGDSDYEIGSVSEHNLVGAKLDKGDRVFFALFSSSYSRVTYTGKPWVHSQTQHGCSGQYNSFLAVYEVTRSELDNLPEPPHWKLAEEPGKTDRATVYCFMSQPADRG